ncbi:hypothetical protein LOTGIDRAFT_154271 [Lottia gigantea]|uniref:BTB domain-containing protein n=1 Tax=Lottia gigantea TaxID=225164 RepID=V3ZDI7_LOTGI|nr:hypothetical protein LOTGIDRAFT_154271 [Lottia gigantea]ESO89183.1 hypothetical protein LOTGIDRAFT_154271 [Lottia gigantea]
MEFNTTSPLLSTEDLKFDLEFESDNDSVTSSGYDSGNPNAPEYWSDSDNEELFDDNDDLMIYENSKPIINTMEYILSMPSLCDVIFIVGEEKTQQMGLKAALASRNRYLCKLIIEEENKMREEEMKMEIKKSKFSVFKKKTNKPTQQKLTINIEHYDAEVFDKILNFLHLGQVCVTPETVIGLMCAAEEFDIPELQKACWDFSFRCLDNGNVATIVNSSKQYRSRLAAHMLTSKLIEMAHGPRTTSV